MSLLARFLERRSSPENPSTNLSNPASWLWDAFGATQSSTGVTVNQHTALQSTAVYACVRILAESVASLPLPVFRRRSSGGKDIARDHPLYRILHDRPNPEMSSFTFRETLQGHLALWGNAYAEIEMAKSGRVLALWPLRPDTVSVLRRPNGERVYQVKVDGVTVDLPPDRVLHIPGLGFDGLVGYSPIALARQAVGLALATEEFGAKFFGNGSRPGGVLSHPQRLSPDAKQRLKDGWQAAYGGLTNSQRVAVLEEGVTWTAIGVPPNEAQFLETRKFQTTEIARIFRVPPHMLADLDRATFSNIEHQSIEFVTHTVRPWLVRWEQAMNWSLFSDRDQGEAFAEFQVEGLLRGDSQQRAAFYQSLFAMGVLSTNDIREKENLNPVEGGDVRLVPLNMTTLEHAGEQPEPAPAPQPVARDSTDTDGRSLGVDELMRDVARRMTRREATQARRAVKRGREAFTAWIDEFYDEHTDTIALALWPMLRGAALCAGASSDRAVEIAEVYAAAVAIRWARDSVDSLRQMVARDDWETTITAWIDALESRELSDSIATVASAIATNTSERVA